MTQINNLGATVARLEKLGFEVVVRPRIDSKPFTPHSKPLPVHLCGECGCKVQSDASHCGICNSQIVPDELL